MGPILIGASTTTSWYGGPPAYNDAGSYAIGVTILVVAVVGFAWTSKMIVESGSWYRNDVQRPLWSYIGLVALWFGAQGSATLAFSHRFSSLLVIVSIIGLLITVVAIATGNLRFWRPKKPVEKP